MSCLSFRAAAANLSRTSTDGYEKLRVLDTFDPYFKEYADDSVLESLERKETSALLLHLMTYFGKRAVVLKKKALGYSRRAKRPAYVFYVMLDSRWVECRGLPFDCPVTIWVLESGTGRLMKHGFKPHTLPRTYGYSEKAKKIRKRLPVLLGLPDDGGAEPADRDQLVAYLRSVGLDRRVVVTYMVNLKVRVGDRCYTGEDAFLNPDRIDIRAFTGSDGRMRFAASPKSRLRETAADRRADRLQAEHAAAMEREPEPEGPNLQSAVKINETGLNLAVRLAASRGDLEYVGRMFAERSAQLWFAFDDAQKVRHVTVTSLARPTKIVYFNEAGDPDSWRVVFDTILDHQAKATAAKMTSLARILMMLEQRTRASGVRTPYADCRRQLLAAAKVYRVFVFCDGDRLLHAVKTPMEACLKDRLAASGRTRNARLRLTTVGDHCLTALSKHGIVVQNLSDLLGRQTGDFDQRDDASGLLAAARDWIPWVLVDKPLYRICRTPLILDSVRRGLRYQPGPFSRDHPHSHFSAAKYLSTRGELFGRLVGSLWCAYAATLRSELNFDVACQSSPVNPSRLAFNLVWHRYATASGPLVHSIEKVHPYMCRAIRRHCAGGFFHSARCRLTEGAPLHADLSLDGPPAATVREYDLTSAYGHAATMSRAASASGFATVVMPGQRERRFHLARRHRSFEYMGVMLKVHLLSAAPEGILSVYSNYSPLGVFCVGKHPVDLAVVREDGVLLLYQFDGHYFHGHHEAGEACKAATPGRRYVGGLTRGEVEARTRARDHYITDWARSCDSGNVRYRVIPGCCDPYFGAGNLARNFNAVPELAALVDGLDDADRLTLDLGKADLEKVTFLAEVANLRFAGEAPGADADGRPRFPPVFPKFEVAPRERRQADAAVRLERRRVRRAAAPAGASDSGSDSEDEDENPTEDDGECEEAAGSRGAPAATPTATTLLTSDYFAYLVGLNNGMTYDRVNWVAYYRRSDALPRAFSHLLNRREAARRLGAGSKEAFYKSVVNVACGYFGLNQGKAARVTATLCDSLPRSYSTRSHRVDLTGDEFDGEPYVIVRHYRSAAARRYRCLTPLPLFAGIVEHGKMRLNAVYRFFQENLRPDSYRLVYSNVDNVIVGLATDEPWEARLPHLTERRVRKAWAELCPEVGAPAPGQLKAEWKMPKGSGWDFVTPGPMYYCVVALNPPKAPNPGGLHKASSLKGLSTREAFEVAVKLLSGKRVAVDQVRRVDKMANTETATVTYTYGAEEEEDDPLPDLSQIVDDLERELKSGPRSPGLGPFWVTPEDDDLPDLALCGDELERELGPLPMEVDLLGSPARYDDELERELGPLVRPPTVDPPCPPQEDDDLPDLALCGDALERELGPYPVGGPADEEDTLEQVLSASYRVLGYDAIEDDRDNNNEPIEDDRHDAIDEHHDDSCQTQ